jgi:hypothetical protein
MCACVVVVFSVACASRKATRADAPAMATASVLQGSAAAGAQPLVAAAAAGACRCHDTQRSAETHQLSGATLTLAASAAAPAPAPAGTGWRRRWTACLALGLMIKFGLGTLVSIGSSQNQGHFRAATTGPAGRGRGRLGLTVRPYARAVFTSHPRYGGSSSSRSRSQCSAYRGSPHQSCSSTAAGLSTAPQTMVPSACGGPALPSPPAARPSAWRARCVKIITRTVGSRALSGS